jgi:hypothetical protein
MGGREDGILTRRGAGGEKRILEQKDERTENRRADSTTER